MPPPPTTHDLVLRGKSHFAHANRNRRTPKDLVLATLTDEVLALTHRALHRDVFLSQSLAFLHALSADPPATAAQADARLATHERAYALPSDDASSERAALLTHLDATAAGLTRNEGQDARIGALILRRDDLRGRLAALPVHVDREREALRYAAHEMVRRREAVEARSAALETEYRALVEVEQRLRGVVDAGGVFEAC